MRRIRLRRRVMTASRARCNAMARVLLVAVYLMLAVASSNQQQCSETIIIEGINKFHQVSLGTVCFQCGSGDGRLTDAEFQLNNAKVGENVGTVLDGVLTVINTGDVFQQTAALSCYNNGSVRYSNHILLSRALRPPRVAAEVEIKEGEILVLTCDASNSYPAPTVSWIAANGMGVNGTILEIDNVQRNQSGNYSCIVTAKDGSTQSSTTIVSITTGPDTEEDVEVMPKFPLGGTLELSCNITDGTVPNISWTHNDTKLPNSLVTFTESTTTLTRYNLRSSDSGTYRCIIVSENSSESTTFLIGIQYKSEEDDDDGIEVSQSEEDDGTVSTLLIAAASGGGGILITLIICAIVCFVVFLRKRSSNNTIVNDVPLTQLPERSSHVYEALPVRMTCNDGIYNNPSTFIPTKTGAKKPPIPMYSSDDEYVEIKPGVSVKPKAKESVVEEYDFAAFNPLVEKSRQQRVGGGGGENERVEGESEEEFDEVENTDSETEEPTISTTNM